MIDNMLLLFGVALFVAVVLGLESAYVWWNTNRGPEARRIERRLRAASAGAHASEQLNLLKQRALSDSQGLARLLLNIPRIHRVDLLINQSGLSMTVGNLLGMAGMLFAMGLLGGVFLGHNTVLALAVGIALGFLPFFHVFRARTKRMRAFETQLPDAIDLMGRAMRAGHAFPTALQMVGQEMPNPSGMEFRILFDETNYGVSLHDALLNLLERMPSTDLQYFTVAVLIQRETGGNLAELMDNISSIIRSRIKLMGEIRTLSAEGRLSAWILSGLPFATGAMIQLVNPGFLEVLWKDPVGMKLIYGAILLMCFGVWWMSRIIKIRV